MLEALEPLLLANEMLWAHVSVMDGPLPKQMRDWNPLVQDQPDDYIDAVSGAVTETPERVGAKIRSDISEGDKRNDWRPASGTFEVIT
jgi:hypothetical protein